MAQIGGHWERTPEAKESMDYQIHGSTELDPFLFLLGTEEASLCTYGLSMIKQHVNLMKQGLTQPEMSQETFLDQLMELNCSAAQIEQYLFNIKSVPRGLAIDLLGTPLTDFTQSFITSYSFYEVGNTVWDNSIARQVRALNLGDYLPTLQEDEQAIVTRLLRQPPHVHPKINPVMESKHLDSNDLSEQKTPISSALATAFTVEKRISEEEFAATRVLLLKQATDLSAKLVVVLTDLQKTPITRNPFFRTAMLKTLHDKENACSQEIAFVGSLIELLRRMEFDTDISTALHALKEDLFNSKNGTSIVREIQFGDLPKQMILQQYDIQLLLTSIETLSQASMQFSPY